MDLITPPKRRRRPQADTGKAAVTLVVPTPPKRRRNSKGVAAVDAEAGSRESLDKEHVRVVELAWLAEAEGSLVVPDRAAADDKENAAAGNGAFSVSALIASAGEWKPKTAKAAGGKRRQLGKQSAIRDSSVHENVLR